MKSWPYSECNLINKYPPKGVYQVVMEIINPELKRSQELIFF